MRPLSSSSSSSSFLLGGETSPQTHIIHRQRPAGARVTPKPSPAESDPQLRCHFSAFEGARFEVRLGKLGLFDTYHARPGFLEKEGSPPGENLRPNAREVPRHKLSKSCTRMRCLDRGHVVFHSKKPFLHVWIVGQRSCCTFSHLKKPFSDLAQGPGYHALSLASSVLVGCQDDLLLGRKLHLYQAS